MQATILPPCLQILGSAAERPANLAAARQQALEVLQQEAGNLQLSDQERAINKSLEGVVRAHDLDALLGPPGVNVAGLHPSADMERLNVRTGLDLDTVYAFFYHLTALSAYHGVPPQSARWAR